MMVTKILLPILAILGMTFAVAKVLEAKKPEPVAQPIVEPPTRPGKVQMIAGSGLVEARRENIPIGVNIPGVVAEIYVKKGELVKPGTPFSRRTIGSSSRCWRFVRPSWPRRRHSYIN